MKRRLVCFFLFFVLAGCSTEQDQQSFDALEASIERADQLLGSHWQPYLNKVGCLKNRDQLDALGREDCHRQLCLQIGQSLDGYHKRQICPASG